MKSSTSLWECSRKYSAIVRPASGTRRRAPAVSFIWPKTSAVLSITPDSFISFQRSLPSRERSPTPANTEYPLCSKAMFRISSSMRTVLPTPAPPKRPILPPLAYGVIRSMTLMPVSSTSPAGTTSTKSGARWWIGQRSAAGIGPARSIGSPVTLIMRPSIPSLAGTEIGAPVSTASMPRDMPSVGRMEMQRTSPFPSCCRHSST